MRPSNPMVIDNRPTQPVFLEGNPLTDGMAEFAASLINAGPAAAQVRRQREQDRMAEVWRQREYDRSMGSDKRSADYQQAQIANMRADNARQMMAMFGNGANNAAKTIAGLFGRGNGSAGVADDWHVFEGKDGTQLMLNKRTGEIKPAAMTPAEGEPAPAADESTGWPGVAVLGTGAGAGLGAYAAGKYMAGKGKAAAKVAPGAAPAATGAATKGAGALATLWNGAKTAGRFASKAALPLAAATGAGMSVYDATQADSGADTAANLAGAAGYAALLPAALKGVGAVPALATLPVGAITSTIKQEVGGTPDQGAENILRAYASGQTQPRLGMWSRGMGILANGDTSFPDQNQQQRVSEILHAVNVTLPEATSPDQMAKRQMILGRIEQAAWADDPTELQAQLNALFPNLAPQR